MVAWVDGMILVSTLVSVARVVIGWGIMFTTDIRLTNQVTNFVDLGIK